MNNKKEKYLKILKILTDFGRLPTTKIAAISGINYEYIKPLLDELLKQNKIKRIEETLATYWEIQ